MKVGNYKIGRYHAIIKKFYEDGSYDYETSFESEDDLMESFFALDRCIGKTLGIHTDSPKVLSAFLTIRGKENIKKELGVKQSEKEVEK